MNAHETNRVRRHTPPATNRRIDDRIAESIHEHAHASPAELTARLRQLEREWDIERVLETNAAALALAGLVLAAWRGPRWLLLTTGVAGFLLLHGVQGWCPPVPLLRRLGIRTAEEIDREKFALRFLRGDFAEAQGRRGPRVGGLARAVTS